MSGVGGVGGRTSPLGVDERRSSTSGSSGRLATEETLAYTVHGSDTLTSVAARFDTTPSELVSLNKLHSRLIFPGQVNLRQLFLPLFSESGRMWPPRAADYHMTNDWAGRMRAA